MSDIIRLLPDHVANQIAAGEVVQRPASVVKELVENSVDAGATEIKLILKEAGKTLIQVIDNGKGMQEQDALMCFERHATSKIAKAEDLFALQTKGFRGEALASIAAIAHVELKTRTSAQELGTHIVIEGTKLISQEPVVTPVGTSFSVKNLFFNIPARRNFLKSVNVEFRAIIDEFERIALVHCDIQFTLIHNDNEVFNLPISNLRQRIVAVFGARTNEKLVPIKESTEIVEISGFVGKPEYAKKTRGEQFFFVNDRFIRSGYLHHAVLAAYEGLLKDNTNPTYFIYLQVPSDSIDINIHPTKTEVKFDDEQALYSILRSTIKHSMGQFNVAPVLDFHRDSSLDTPYDYQGTQAATPTIEVDRNFNPFVRGQVVDSDKFEYNPFESESESSQGLIASKMQEIDVSSMDLDLSSPFDEHQKSVTLESKSNQNFEAYKSRYTSNQGYISSKGNDSNSMAFESKVNLSSSSDTGFASKVNTDLANNQAFESTWQGNYSDLQTDITTANFSSLEIESAEQDPTLFDQTDTNVAGSRSFQINRKYIVSPIKSGLVVIDQARAHQRILFEKFQESINTHQSASQQLLFPLTLHYTPFEIGVLKELTELLQQAGFGFEEFGQEHVVISGLPVSVSESEASVVLEDLLLDFLNDFPDKKFDLSQRIAKSLSRSLAVKSGINLSQEEQENIVNSLFACQEPNVSPFMKPTFITMKVEDIEKKFML
ncbi:DNA mismatch repair endonuclease MutL [Myroides sp. LJL119]